MELTPIENTAWLTVYCRYLESRKKKPFLKDPVAEWLIEQVQPPSFKNTIRRSVLSGVPVRTVVLDELIRQEIDKAKAGQYTFTYIAIGSGLDARWERFGKERGGVINDYYEVDFRNILEYKRHLLATSPFDKLYDGVRTIAADVKKGLPVHLPRINSPALVVLEGIMMYLSPPEQANLLASIRRKAPGAVVLADVYNAYAAQTANKKSQRSTGSEQVAFAAAPADPVSFYSALGCQVQTVIPLIKEIIIRNKSLLRFIPMPKKIMQSYLLLKMVP